MPLFRDKPPPRLFEGAFLRFVPPFTLDGFLGARRITESGVSVNLREGYVSPGLLLGKGLTTEANGCSRSRKW